MCIRDRVQNEANQEQRNVTDGAENDEVSENAGIGNEETTDHTDPEEAIENSEQADENQDSVQGQKDQHTIIEEVPEQSETQLSLIHILQQMQGLCLLIVRNT